MEVTLWSWGATDRAPTNVTSPKSLFGTVLSRSAIRPPVGERHVAHDDRRRHLRGICRHDPPQEGLQCRRIPQDGLPPQRDELDFPVDRGRFVMYRLDIHERVSFQHDAGIARMYWRRHRGRLSTIIAQRLLREISTATGWPLREYLSVFRERQPSEGVVGSPQRRISLKEVSCCRR
jgi:hypothetical protein